ncbi:platelet endothelial aggregation receptor 1-like isoform X3 [Zootermopsis nevadensis]|uniref:platelet endothelial aggregation receptor 1-like isoform X3 n=1 Tax=Zootermopsis nevadensis TaxID=136037 RepID=UPI000B8E9FC8|nr:platelet endothelial aggregation receptor 1-like isoform X3 [Zootermopsis nevadensis]
MRGSICVFMSIVIILGLPDSSGTEKVGLGDKCNASSDCASGLQTRCLHGFCSCEIGYRSDPDKQSCVPQEIGEACEDSRECYVAPNARRCDRGVCRCAPLYTPSRKNNNTCLKVSNYNEFCEEHDQCVTKNTRCEAPKCVCDEGYRWDSSMCVNSQGTSSPEPMGLTSAASVHKRDTDSSACHLTACC